jgi:hypothetical protein
MGNDTASSKRAVLRPGFLWMCLSLIALPSLSQTTKDCAWINTATAAGFLGGDVVASSYQAASKRPAVCVFTKQTDSGIRTLRVTVERSEDAHARFSAVARTCGADAAFLRAIGNEAVVCRDDRKGGLGEQVVGRVRNQVFTITLISTGKDDQLLTRSALKDSIYTAAELVSGNLF